ncbi:hypothetical protein AADX40_15550 [Aeromonas veronii]|uniref:hypothetical protein n=1 Tax=Aeromonas TaxID=642 RepID=UPI0031595C34
MKKIMKKNHFKNLWSNSFIKKGFDKASLGLFMAMVSFQSVAVDTNKGLFGMGASVAKEQGGYWLETVGTGMQVLGFSSIAWGVWMVIQHQRAKKQGGGQDTSWGLILTLIVGGAVALGFGSFVDVADSTAWGSAGGNAGKLQIQ